jgi:hypothetical protein
MKSLIVEPGEEFCIMILGAVQNIVPGAIINCADYYFVASKDSIEQLGDRIDIYE